MLRVSPILVTALALTLGACGKAEKKVEGPVEKAIYVSAGDCAEGGKLSGDECSSLIEKAVASHEKSAPVFKSLQACEDAAGIDRCERGVGDAYRMQLQAFMVTTSKPSAAAPLYPSEKGKVGFRDEKKVAIAAPSDAYAISNAALTVAHDNAKLIAKAKKKK